MMAPLIEIVTNNLNVKVEKLSSDKNPSAFQKHNVTSVPTLILVDDNDNTINRHTGMMSKPKLEKFLEG